MIRLYLVQLYYSAQTSNTIKVLLYIVSNLLDTFFILNFYSHNITSQDNFDNDYDNDYIQHANYIYNRKKTTSTTVMSNQYTTSTFTTTNTHTLDFHILCLFFYRHHITTQTKVRNKDKYILCPNSWNYLPVCFQSNQMFHGL